MYNWADSYESNNHKYLGLILFGASASLAVILFLTFHPQIDEMNRQSPILINIMFIPAMAVGFLYGVRITEKAVKPSELRSPIKRSIVKIFLFFFVIGGMFSSVNFAINGGSIMPDVSIFEDGLLVWVNSFVIANGGATFLIITSITLMAAATKRIVGLNTGFLNRLVTFVGTFVFFTMLVLSFTKSDPTSSGVFLYTFYQAGIVGGAFFAMNRLTKNQNMLEDFSNGF
ncbi:hypothetical protein NKOR_06830 [Candidatus Nitrosopumilus koreensis AR1]|uniref:Uncharacterized protein n=1 Tax=Candidatus Nitrosopumilus koreensis AR1 TaxID=1229908 RepID=K0B6W9_9ARCH|nr:MULTISPECIES: hypothetical protein [Nitrosopumilus]AFS81239.1 hypothetical protein NKOR_06830 [Candidatus Nitrosopumilus koreensis AR1]